MQELGTLVEDYKIGASDVENIRKAAPLVLANKEKIADHHYDRLLSKHETASFFADDKVFERARTAFIKWLEDLVSGDFSLNYFLRLNRIGAAHVRIGLPAHHVNVQISLARSYIGELVSEQYSHDPGAAGQIMKSLNKIIDLNLDLMTRSYREEELMSNFISHKLDHWLIRSARWFVNGFNMALVVGLVMTGVFVFGLGVYDFSNIGTVGLERAVLAGLGTLLILWVVIELLDTQIRHMKGHAFAIKVFVSVALVAELRKVLMSTIGHATWQEQSALVASVLVLGIIFWLISRVEKS